MCGASKTGERRRCPSAGSYRAHARANGNRRHGRLARRKIAEHLAAGGLGESAAVVLASPPSMLVEFMAAMGISTAVLGDTPMPGAGPKPASAAEALRTATAEKARLRRATASVAQHLRARGLHETAAVVLASPPSMLAEFMAALGISTAVLGDTPMPGAGPNPASAAEALRTAQAEAARQRSQAAAVRLAQSVARTRATAPLRTKTTALAGDQPNCRANLATIAKWESIAEDVFAEGASKAGCRAACAEAEMLCKGCPLLQSCAQEAKVSRYTGVAGGRIFVNGRSRLTPSNPARIVA